MYNDIDNDIITLDLPNIVYAFPKGTAQEFQRNMTIFPFLHPLILKIAKARPNWRLVGYDHHGNFAGAKAAKSFAVFEGGVELGMIARGYNYCTSQDVFTITNARIRSKRQRGGEVRTKCIKKAFKTVTSEFHAKTVAELVADSVGVVSTAVGRAVAGPYNRNNSNRRAIEYAALDFAKYNWEQFDKFARKQGVPSVHLDTYHEVEQDYAYVSDLSDMYHKEATMRVILRGSEYIIARKDNTEILSSEQLSPYMKRAVGLLKLAEVNTFIPTVGVKASPDTMLVMPEKGEADD